MTATSLELWGPFLVAMAVALVITPISIKVAPKIGAMDVPKDERRMHNKAMPRFGGVAIYAGIMVSLAGFALDDGLAFNNFDEVFGTGFGTFAAADAL